MNNADLEAWRRDHPPLPETFIDSPEAVRALAGQGVDFISGSTDISISLRMIHNQPTWHTYDRLHDKDVYAPAQAK